MRSVLFFIFVLSFFSNICCAALDVPHHLHLTWGNSSATNSSMVVSWREGDVEDSNSRVYYDVVSRGCVAVDYVNDVVPESVDMVDTSDFIRHAELTGLSADTLYYFCVVNSQGSLGEYSFRTAPSSGGNFSFVLGGDSKSDVSSADFASMSSYALSYDPLFILYGGDAVDSGIDSDWSTWFEEIGEHFITPSGRMVPVIHVLANHELISDTDASFYGDYYEYPDNELYFYHDFGDLRVVTLFSPGASSSLSSIDDSDQLSFIESVLGEGKDNAKWLVTQYHQPIYPSYRSPDARTSLMRDNWIPLFDNYHVHLSHEAHDHTFKRSYPIFNGSVNESGFGTVFLGDGSWPQSRTPANLDVNGWALEVVNGMKSISIISIPEKPYLEFDNTTWISVVSVNDTGHEHDSFLIPDKTYVDLTEFRIDSVIDFNVTIEKNLLIQKNVSLVIVDSSLDILSQIELNDSVICLNDSSIIF